MVTVEYFTLLEELDVRSWSPLDQKRNTNGTTYDACET
jgi:hypothetical protein